MPAYQQDNGTWYASFYAIDHKGESRHVLKRGFETEEEADAYEEAYKERAADPSSYSFSDFVNCYFSDIEPRIRWSTFEKKKEAFAKWITPYFGKKKLGDISSLDILHWQIWISEQRKKNGSPLAATYIRKINSEVSAIFNHAARHYDLDPNPTKKVKKSGKSKSDEMQIWTSQEYRKFLEAICDKDRSFYAFELFYWTGVRLGELLALEPADFDFDACKLTINKSLAVRKGEIIIGPPKTKQSYRTISIPRFLSEEIRYYVEEVLQIDEYTRIFEGMSKSYLHHEMDRGCAASGVKRIRIHDLRHTHVSILIDMGFSAVAIADRVGHESTDITFRYAHLFPNSQENMAIALNDIRKAS